VHTYEKLQFFERPAGELLTLVGRLVVCSAFHECRLPVDTLLGGMGGLTGKYFAQHRRPVVRVVVGERGTAVHGFRGAVIVSAIRGHKGIVT
jgi:hypothetical protein